MYVEKADLRQGGLGQGDLVADLIQQLDQGDVLTEVIRPLTPTEESIQQRSGPRVDVATHEQLKRADQQLRVQVKTKKLDFALILSNGCDIAQGSPILIAPIVPFKFPEKAGANSEKWEVISRVATGGPGPPGIHLAASKEFNLPRSTAGLDAMVPITAGTLQRCVTDWTSPRGSA